MRKISMNKVASALFAVASSILTDILCSEFSSSYYQIEVQGDVQKIVEINGISFGWKVIILFSIFIIIWGGLSVIPRLINHFSRPLLFTKKRLYRSSDIIRVFVEEKNAFFQALEKYHSLRESPSGLNVSLLSKEVSSSVEKLHSAFLPRSEIHRTAISSAFSLNSSSGDMESRIALYEYKALIQNLENLFNEVCLPEYTSTSDYENINRKLVELKGLEIELIP